MPPAASPVLFCGMFRIPGIMAQTVKMDRSLSNGERVLTTGEWLPTPETAVVWLTEFPADATPWLVEMAAEQLNAGELARAERMRLAEARAEFLLGRALLRSLLAERLGCSAAEVPLEAVPQHKPRLAAGRGPLEFNLSHSGGRIALVMTQGIPVGIDIESSGSVVEFLEIASSHFAAAERTALLRSFGEGRARCFFRLWTRKEAVVKAAGDGLTLPLDGFDVSPVLPEELALTIDSLEAGRTVWHVRDLDVDGPFAAAIAFAQPGMIVRRIALGEQQIAALLQAGAGARPACVA
jgi:4'-phosphopantetheinyl transferase